jgi:hypothetical protein
MEKTHTPHHPWRARLIVGILMLIFAFIGLIVSDVMHDGAWIYWRAIIPVYALLSLALSYYLRKNSKDVSSITLWHELLHWLALIGGVYLISVFVNMGLVGRFEASLQVLILLALTTFLAGIYNDMIFMIVGLLLGCFTSGAAFFTEYLYTIMLPLTILAALIMYGMIHYHARHSK